MTYKVFGASPSPIKTHILFPNQRAPTPYIRFEMIFILSFLFFIQSITGVPVPAVITRWHTAEAVTSTLLYTTGTTTVWLPPVEVLISGDCTTTFTITSGQWATTPVTTTSYAAGQQDGDDQPEPTHTDNAQPNSPAETTTATTAETTDNAPANTPDNTSDNTPDNTPENTPENTQQTPESTSAQNTATENSSPTSTAASPSSAAQTTSTGNNDDNSQTTASPSSTSIEVSTSASTTESSLASASGGANVLSVASQGGYKFSLALNKLKRPDVIVYSPYGNDGSCKSYAEVLIDLIFLKLMGFSKIRTYGVDCNILSAVLPLASKLGFTVNQGFWISDKGVDSIDDSVSNLIDYAEKNGWDVFDYITIGNEAIIEGYDTVSNLIAKIKSVKKKLQDAGYKGKVTTSEPPIIYRKHPELCTDSDIDFVGINSHSYFNTNLYADEAGKYVASQQKEIAKICSKKTVITETGYPSKGIKNGNNVPSLSNQYAALKSIVDATDGDCTILSSFNDYWKNPGPYGIEQAFGVIGFF